MVPPLHTQNELMQRDDQIRKYVRGEAVIFRVTSGEFGGLSNMAPNYPLRVNTLRIGTAEALYQACRYPNHPDIQAEIIDQPSPMTAKMKSKKYHSISRPDWNKRRVSIMRWCLRVKLAENWSRFSSLLLKTSDKPIVEESKKDSFWGAMPNDDGTLVGMNVLGRLLMELRQEIRTKPKDQLLVVKPPERVPDFVLLGSPIMIFEIKAEEIQSYEHQPELSDRTKLAG